MSDNINGFLSIQENKIILATCNLNQWALDFDGNLARTMESIRIAKEKGAKYRLGPELELSGYSCEDHFLEMDTFMHCEQSLATILKSDVTDNILCDIGCPVLHNNVRYNCRVYCLNRKIVFIRPKFYLADDGNYREKRFFASWNFKEQQSMQDHTLSDLLRTVTGQVTVPIGVAVVRTQETTLASEICEELWTAKSPHIDLFLQGCEIISNGSGSHHQLRKLNSRLDLIRSATSKCGGVYLFSNHRGCDGNRLYFDGSSLVAVNGQIVTIASQFSLRDVEVITAVVDLDEVRSYRGNIASLQEQSAQNTIKAPAIDLRHFSLRNDTPTSLSVTKPTKVILSIPEEECCRGPACWLWDYLRRSGATGFLLPLSGGADSSSVAAIVRVMTEMVAEAVLVDHNKQVINDVRRLFKTRRYESSFPFLNASNNHALDVIHGVDGHAHGDAEDTLRVNKSTLANELTYQLLHTVYMGTTHSSIETQDRARKLAGSIQAYHNTLFIDEIVAAVVKTFQLISGQEPKFVLHGGSMTEDLALQNIQARLRMVMAYLCAQLFPWVRSSGGFLLVLGSANVDEALRGYMTKYDCSSADLNPIGGINKRDLKNMLNYVGERYELPVLKEIVEAPPSAELRPIDTKAGQVMQLDEEEMGMTYDELGVYGPLRKIQNCGPVKMFMKLCDLWNHLSPAEVATKVKRFFKFYAINRHKMTVLTPSYHAENYSPDDNRFDLRPFLYNIQWTRQFNTIDNLVTNMEKRK